MNALRSLLSLALRWPRAATTPAGVTSVTLTFPPGVDLDEAVRPALRQAGVAVRVQASPRTATLTLAERQLDGLALALGEHLGAVVARDTRVRAATGPEVSLAYMVRAGRARWVEGFIAENRIAIHYQPIVHADDPTRVYGHEALMRGHTREGDPVPPVALLEPARETGLLAQLDLHARLVALRESRRLGIPRAIFLNFSPQAVGEGRRHLDATIALVDWLGLRREDLVFEITETERIEDPAAFQRVLGEYREAGFRLALDDIGSGYSSLHLIDALRPDFVKVDMSLVRKVHADAFRASITAKLIELAAGLGLTTIAEGVEEVAEWRWLREHGADLVQGYLFGRPASPPGAPADPAGRPGAPLAAG